MHQKGGSNLLPPFFLLTTTGMCGCLSTSSNPLYPLFDICDAMSNLDNKDCNPIFSLLVLLPSKIYRSKQLLCLRPIGLPPFVKVHCAK